MMRSLVLRFSGDAGVAVKQLTALGDQVIAVADLSEILRGSRPGRGATRLAILGRPPEDEIGFGLVPFLGLVYRPTWITLIDGTAGTLKTVRLGRFLVSAVPGALLQLGASAAAIVAQGAIATLLRAPSKTTVEGLRRIVYLRPLVGVPASVGGAVTHTHEVIRGLRASGVRVDAYTTDASIVATAQAENDPQCEWRLIKPARYLRALPASAAFAADLALMRAAFRDAREADAIYQRHTRFSLAGALLARIVGKPLILEYNGSEAFFGRHWQPTPLLRHLARLERAALRAAAHIVVVSNVEQSRLAERLGLLAERVIVNPNGVDVQRFDRGGGEDVRRRLALNGSYVVGFVGSFGPWHGAPVLAAAFVQLMREVPHARLLLVGDGPELPEVRAILKKGGVAGAVVEVGKVTPSAVPAYLDACDVLASPHVSMPDGGEFFGSPTKLFEYMAAGKPIVASALGQIADVLEHEMSALLVPAGDPDVVAAALSRLGTDPELRERLGRASRECAKGHTWADNISRLRVGVEHKRRRT